MGLYGDYHPKNGESNGKNIQNEMETGMIEGSLGIWVFQFRFV